VGCSIHAERPAAIRLSVDRDTIAANGSDVAHITVEIIDSAGVVVPTADNLVLFTIKGPGHLIGVGNGNPIDHDSFKASQRRTFNGLCLAIVQSEHKAGKISFKASSDGLKKASVEIEVKYY
jgi:beta-galactosidase